MIPQLNDIEIIDALLLLLLLFFSESKMVHKNTKSYTAKEEKNTISSKHYSQKLQAHLLKLYVLAGEPAQKKLFS